MTTHPRGAGGRLRLERDPARQSAASWRAAASGVTRPLRATTSRDQKTGSRHWGPSPMCALRTSGPSRTTSHARIGRSDAMAATERRMAWRSRAASVHHAVSVLVPASPIPIGSCSGTVPSHALYQLGRRASFPRLRSLDACVPFCHHTHHPHKPILSRERCHLATCRVQTCHAPYVRRHLHLWHSSNAWDATRIAVRTSRHNASPADRSTAVMLHHTTCPPSPWNSLVRQTH